MKKRKLAGVFLMFALIVGFSGCAETSPKVKKMLKENGIKEETVCNSTQCDGILQNIISLETAKKYIEEDKKVKALLAEDERRKSTTYPLRSSKEYVCDPYNGFFTYFARSSGNRIHHLLSTSRGLESFTILENEFNFKASYPNYDLYIGYDKEYNKLEAKVYSQKGINGTNVNLLIQNTKYYCAEKAHKLKF